MSSSRWPFFDCGDDVSIDGAGSLGNTEHVNVPSAFNFSSASINHHEKQSPLFKQKYFIVNLQKKNKI